jgi:hypothetical protein
MRSIASRRRCGGCGIRHAAAPRSNLAISTIPSEGYPKIFRARSVIQNSCLSQSRTQRPASAASAAKLRRSSLSRSAWSARLRASALVKIWAINCNLAICPSDHECSLRVAFSSKAPIGGSPPTESGSARPALMPKVRNDSRSRPASSGSLSSDENSTTRPAAMAS